MPHKPLRSRTICKSKPTHPPGTHGTHLHPYRLEQRRVSEGKFHHLLDLSQLLAAATYVIIAHFIQWLLFILSRRKYIKHLSENNSSSTPSSLQNLGIWIFAHSHFFAVLRVSFSSLAGVFYSCFLVLSSKTCKWNCLHIIRAHWSPSSWMTASTARFPTGSSAKQALWPSDVPNKDNNRQWSTVYILIPWTVRSNYLRPLTSCHTGLICSVFFLDWLRLTENVNTQTCGKINSNQLLQCSSTASVLLMAVQISTGLTYS